MNSLPGRPARIIERDETALNIVPKAGDSYADALRRSRDSRESVAPYALSLGIVSECGTSKCGYCSNWRSSAHREMPIESIVEVLDDAVALGVTQVLFSGGEPLFHSNWLAAMEAARERGIDVLLITNGLLLDEPAVESLMGVGCKKIGISCDSLDDRLYRKIRGTERAPLTAALSRLADVLVADPSALNISLCMTLHRENSHEVLDILQFAADRGFSAQYQPYQRIGGGLNSVDKRFWPVGEQLDQIERDIAEVRRRKKAGTASVASRDEYLAAIPGYFRTGNFHPVSCFAPVAQITIDEHGGLHPCWAMDAVATVGSDGTLADLWNGPAMGEARRLAADVKCPGCLYSCHLSKSYIDFPDESSVGDARQAAYIIGDGVLIDGSEQTFLGMPSTR